MKKLADGVFLERAYPGVTLGALVSAKGIVMIDAPVRPEDGRAWQKALQEKTGGSEKLLINLDSHPDRTLGVQAVESRVLAHQTVAAAFNNRSTIFKAQAIESGAEWETCTGLSGTRWVPPELMYSKQIWLHWGPSGIKVEHHPGPELGSSWVILPELKIVFVGDLVVVGQPPFLENCDLKAWGQALDLLLSKEFEGFKIIGGRGGVLAEKDIQSLGKFLSTVDKQLQRLAKREHTPQATEKLVEKLLAGLETPAKHKKFYTQRLKYGLYHCYIRHYYSEG